MKYYSLSYNSEEFHSLTFKKNKDYKIIEKFNGSSISPQSETIECLLFPSNKQGDFFYLASNILVFNQKVFDSLGDLIQFSGEIIPIQVNNEKLFALNVLKVLDCLDIKKSDISYFPEGNIMWVKNYVFLENCIGDSHIFKIKGVELKDIFVSEVFKKSVEEFDLQGIQFKNLT